MADDLPPPVDLSWRERVGALAATFGVEPRRALLVLAGAAVGLTLVAVVAVRAWGAGAPPVPLDLPMAGPATSHAGGGGGGDGPGSDQARGPVYVHVAGAVAQPGVYRLDGSSRIADAIDAAGGPLAGAAPHQLNLAAQVADGTRVYVPMEGETPPADAGGASGASGDGAGSGGGGPDVGPGALINLNTATAAELETLPGVGPAIAKAIIDYRTRHGRFRSVDQLTEVRGIGEARLADIRPHVTV